MKKILFSALLCSFVFGESLLVGAGYKKPLMQVISNLQKDGVNVDGAFAIPDPKKAIYGIRARTKKHYF
ncbi:hypothetical protein [Campylobacter iguaniorum]|uniref:hypothetical protein n=1 Tax=Campylobacter iguaniorum TaxID=1244531 RepID=UPI0007C9543C|nr:hypothetical protein [Campylobacter iguaniorum]